MNILITGSEGFIGTHLMKHLIDNRYNIKGIDRKSGKEVLDITSKDLLNIDIVIHLAAQTSVWNPNIELVVNDNINSFIHIYQLCKQHDIRLIYTSSSCSINETSVYGLTKRFDDDFIKMYGGNVVGLRLHNVYGRNPREDTLFGKCMNNDEITLFNNGENKRHFTYVEDVCESITNSINIEPGLYNVYNPIENSTMEFVEEVSKYKSINIIKSPQIRSRDKESQIVDINIPNIITKPTSIESGLKQIFISNTTSH